MINCSKTTHLCAVCLCVQLIVSHAKPSFPVKAQEYLETLKKSSIVVVKLLMLYLIINNLWGGGGGRESRLGWVGGAKFNREGVNLDLGREGVIGLSRGVGVGGPLSVNILFALLCSAYTFPHRKRLRHH
jgi:hypothetical protein